ncbi:MAG: 23S rRNA (adenine(2503)-C(2))-methyltransferase RlmN [Gammaproteobacteria bacterium]|nr:23S rRNA (adenine(2503)-C(2))-methyltransferase RlmN [Gammaproteobacteria bacterium]MCH9744686.1 23S rRNA (adenine(2503)-C(2))-methyltransferase RlmN [Gammaproteobacteria bacterium]
MPNTLLTNLLGLDLKHMGDFIEQLGEPRYRAQQLIHWIHQQRVIDFNEMTNLSKPLREKLSQCAEIRLPEVMYHNTASDGTAKWLLKFPDKNAIEMVYIPEQNRGTLCVSSQVGCGLNCSFCATGKQGFNRDLSASEIMSQLYIAVAEHKVTNVVFMGMGEPLLNFDAVLSSVNLMLYDHAYGLSKHRVTVSTSGLIPQMLQLQQSSDCALAVSLHAPNNALRNELVPLNKKYPLEQLIPVCQEYFKGKNKRFVTFEYVMLDGINDQQQHAKQLVKLLRNMPCKMNLIPFNPFKGSAYKTSPWPRILKFQQTLNDANIKTWVRRTRGDDIDAACGQLAGKFKDRTGRHQRWQRTGKLVPVSGDNRVFE